MGLGGDPEAAKPNKVAKDVLTAMKEYLPSYMELLRTQIYPTELEMYRSEAGVGRKRQRLYEKLYEEFAPQYAGIQELLANIASEGELGRLLGSGGEAVVASEGLAQQLARQADPEYYQLREQTANRLSELLNKGLTNSEVEAITRGQNRANFSTGISENPSSMSTVGNAMQFGGAARDRLSQAVALATQAFPTMKTNTMTGGSIFEGGTGRGRNINPNMQTTFTGVTGQGMGTAEGFGNNLFQSKLAGMNINANRRDFWDRMNQLSGTLKNQQSTISGYADTVGSFMGGMGG